MWFQTATTNRLATNELTRHLQLSARLASVLSQSTLRKLASVTDSYSK